MKVEQSKYFYIYHSTEKRFLFYISQSKGDICCIDGKPTNTRLSVSNTNMSWVDPRSILGDTLAKLPTKVVRDLYFG